MITLQDRKNHSYADNRYKPVLSRFRSEVVSQLAFAAFFWSLVAPYCHVKAVYVPDENQNPAWVPTAGESTTAPSPANLNDDNQNGTPDWVDDFNAASANGAVTYWVGGTFIVDGVSTTYGGQWHRSDVTDSDGDLIPDDIDPYPSDSTNNSFYWTGGTFTINGIQHSFRAEWYQGASTDGDNDGVPDCLDDWFTNPSAHGTLQHWNGGSAVINGTPNTFDAVDYYAPSYVDSDGDGIPDELDPFPSDPWNNSSFQWQGGDYPVNGVMTHFSPGTYGGALVDTDGDGIPDQADPMPSDPDNNSSWWNGGGFYVDGTYTTLSGQYHRADAGDSDGDGIPDDLDPLPYDGSNWHTFYWEGGYYLINNQYQYFGGSNYSGIWADSDGDGIPDAADPYPSDPNNANVTNQYSWGGGYYTINNSYQWISGGTYSGSWTDSDGDGIPDPADPYAYDSNNGNGGYTDPGTGGSPPQFYWGGGYYTINHQYTEFYAANYDGYWSDSDGDGIPDVADPYPNDSNNGNDNYSWGGGTYRINNYDQWISGGTYSGSWTDSDGDGIPDPADPYPNDSNNGNSATGTFDWAGGTFRVNNVDQYFGPLTYAGTWSDADGDGIPDVADSYPNDSNNGNSTFYWSGGTYRVANADQYFAGGTYPGMWMDIDTDGIPDSLDPYPTDPNNANTQYYWGGGTFTINNSSQSFSAAYYDGSWADSDGDGIPDPVDPYVWDANNGNSTVMTFHWDGGYYTINNSTTYFAPGDYSGSWSDSDGDGIPDVVDPFVYDSNNGNSATFYWSGGTFTINNNSTYFGPGNYPGTGGDSDSDGIPDGVDPYQYDSNNGNYIGDPEFYWAGGTYTINNSSQTFSAGNYFGYWSDQDGDGIPDVADPYPNDPNNNNETISPTFYWGGGTFYVDGVAATWSAGYYTGSWSDSDGDGIPDSLDIHPADSTNNSAFWNGGTFNVDGQPQSFAAQYYPASIGDSDGDGIPDSLDPYPQDATNNEGFTWPSVTTSFLINNQTVAFNPVHYGGALVDSDGDGIPDVADPLPTDFYNGNDTDGDGLPDKVEVLYPGLLSPNNAADAAVLRSDGISYLQAYVYNPLLPLNQPLSSTLDSDGDGMPDIYESVNGLDPHNPKDAANSKMGDYVANVEKYRQNLPLGTTVTQSQYPTVTGQTWADLQAHLKTSLSDAENDWDGDGISNLDELTLFHTNPHSAASCPTDAQVLVAILQSQVSATTLMNKHGLLHSGASEGDTGTGSGGSSGSGSGGGGSGGGTGGSPSSAPTKTFLNGASSSSITPPKVDDVTSDIVTGLPGTLQASADGSATYTIPLTLPKGTAGVEPQLTLSYSSNSGDSYMGVGWTLSGLGTIMRVGSSTLMDNRRTGVNFDENDRFVLNGERLIYVGTRSPMGLLQDGDEFRTEMNQLNRITYHGTETSDYWLVETKDGLKMSFGATSDARISPEVGGENRAITWAANRVEDLKGNYFTISYNRNYLDAPTNTIRYMDFVPDQILYTGHTAGPVVAPYNRIKFQYNTPRLNPTKAYIKGGQIRADRLIDRIEIATSVAEASPFVTTRYYSLSYYDQTITAASPSGRPHLRQVQEFACANATPNPATDTAALPTVFEWNASNAGWTLATGSQWTLPVFVNSDKFDQGKMFADVNGDGLPDILWNHYNGLSFTAKARPGSTPEYSTDWPNESNFSTTYSSTAGALLNTGAGFATAATTFNPPVGLTASGGADAGAVILDLDGDGKVDILSGGSYNAQQNSFNMWRWNGNLPSGSQNKWAWSTIVPGTTFLRWIDTNSYTTGYPTESIYIFGALVEAGSPLVRPGPTKANAAYMGTGSGWGTAASASRFTPPIALSSASYVDAGRRFMDINGDGLPDLVLGFKGSTADAVWLNQGPGTDNTASAGWVKSPTYGNLFAAKVANDPSKMGEFITDGTTAGANGSGGRFFADINGDGLPDFVVSRYITFTTSGTTASTREEKVYLNNGNGFDKVYDNTTNPVVNINGGSAWRFPRAWTGAFSGTDGRAAPSMTLQDVNGDGLPDLVISLQRLAAAKANYCQNFVFLNTGKGWETSPNPNWILPGYLAVYDDAATNPNFQPSRSLLVDVNNDGLLDFVSTYKGRSGVWLNTGNGWGVPTGADVGTYQYPTDAPPWAIKNGLSIPASSVFTLPAAFFDSTGAPIDPYALHTADLDGDGFTDFFLAGPTAAHNGVWINQQTDEVIVKVVQAQDVSHGLGLTTSIGYQPMNMVFTDPYTGKVVYDRTDAAPNPQGSSATVANAIEKVTSQLLVYKITTENGKGGTDENHYRYGQHLVDRKGRGDLGFAWVESWAKTKSKKDPVPAAVDTVIRSRSTFAQSFPYTGMTTRTQSWITLASTRQWDNASHINGERLVNDTQTMYQELPASVADKFPAACHFPYAKTVVNQNFDLETGVLLDYSTTDSTYDNAAGQTGNLKTQVIKTYSEGTTASDLISTKTLNNTYVANSGTGNWIQGRLDTSSMVHEAPGVSPVTKSSKFTYVTSTGMLETEVVEPNGASMTKTYVYDGFGNTTMVIVTAPARGDSAALSQVTNDKFDARGRFSTKTTNALSQSIQRVYDEKTSVLDHSTDANNLEVKNGYDGFGTAKGTTNPDGSWAVKYAKFCTLPDFPSVVYYMFTQASGSPASIAYLDKYGRTVVSESVGFDGTLVRSQVLYDDLGHVIAQSLPYFAGTTPENILWSQKFYDEAGNAWKTVSPGSDKDGSSADVTSVVSYTKHKSTQTLTTTGHDAVTTTIQTNVVGDGGARVRIVTDGRIANAAHKDTTFFSTADGLDWKVRSSNGQEIVKTYNDGRRELATVSDPDAGLTTMTYDGFGRLVKTSHPELGNTVLHYDAIGRVISKTSNEGTWTSHYDTAVAPATGSWVGALFESTGPLVGTSGIHKITSTYDALGRPVWQVEQFSGETYASQTTYGTDINDLTTFGKVVSVQDAGGFVTKTHYTALGFADGTTKADGTMLHQVTAMDARGKVLTEAFGNNVITTHAYDNRSGRLQDIVSTKGAATLQSDSYTTDNLGNVYSRTRKAVGSLAEKKESFEYDALDRLKTSTITGQSSIAATFDDFGNIQTKTSVGSYVYDTSKVNRLDHVDRAGGITQKFYYDGAGRVTGDDMLQGTTVVGRQRTFAYTSFNQVRSIHSTNMNATTTAPGTFASWSRSDIDFWFDAGGNRLRQIKEQAELPNGSTSGQVLRTTTTYLGGFEIEKVQDLAHSINANDPDYLSIEKRHYFAGGMYLEKSELPTGVTAPQPEINLVTLSSTSFYLGDNLGSPEVITDDSGVETERQSYDSWGSRRDGATLAPPAAGSRTLSSHHKTGYTGHEMLDDVGIIHMNGRIYDPEIGRMLSPDPVIQSPENTQNYNAYSYVLNNPLKFTDPTGNSWFSDIFDPFGLAKYISKIDPLFRVSFKAHNRLAKWVKKNYKAVITVVVAIVLIVCTYGAATASVAGVWFEGGTAAMSMAGSAAVGAAVGAGVAASQAAIAGGTWGDIAKAGITGAITGAISGAAAWQLGHMFDGAINSAFGAGGNMAKGVVPLLERSLGDAVVGGALSAGTGGSFKDGFISAGVSSLLAPAYNIDGLGKAGRTAVAAVIGGTASVLSGGKFANGAISAAFMHLLNEELMQKAKRSFVVSFGHFSIWTDSGMEITVNSMDELVGAVSGAYVANPNGNYTGQCATGAQYLCGAWNGDTWYDAPDSKTWRPGLSLADNDPVPGTMIARGWEGTGYPNLSPDAYPSGTPGSAINHVGIFMGRDSAGQILVFNQNAGGNGSFRVDTYPVNNAPGENNWYTVTSSARYSSRASNSMISITRAMPIIPASMSNGFNHR